MLLWRLNYRQKSRKSYTVEKSSWIERTYGLPKFHKTDCLPRPIVSTYNSLIVVSTTPHHSTTTFSRKHGLVIRNLKHFLNRLAAITIHNSDILANFNVASLFTNIPITEASDILRRRNHHNILEDIIHLSHDCMDSTNFIYQNQFYGQTRETLTGSSLSPIIINIFMAYFEQKAITKYLLVSVFRWCLRNVATQEKQHSSTFPWIHL